jgi:hypothetical protein
MDSMVLGVSWLRNQWRRAAFSAVVCGCLLGLAMLAPARAPAATVFFDDFESGVLAAHWVNIPMFPGADQGEWWQALPRGQYVPVASGNYALGVITEPGHYASQSPEIVIGPFQLQGKPNPRLEFDLYRNMPVATAFNDRPDMSLAIIAHSADLAAGTRNLVAYRGSSGRWEHIVVPLDKWGSEEGNFAWEMKNIANYYSPICLSFDFDNSAFGLSDSNPLSYPQPGEGVFIDNVKVAYGAPEVASVVRYPNKSSFSTKRKRAFTLAALICDSRGGGSYGASTVLQTSKNGKSGWKNTYRLVSNSDGIVAKTIRPTKKGTTYYRWVVGSKKTAKQKVVVK